MKKKFFPKLTLSKETLREMTLPPSQVKAGQQLDTIWQSCPSVCRDLC
jgi:hypothetical protein